MEATVLFAGVPVGDFGAALAFYGRLFGRPPDVVAHEHEVLWRVCEGGWLAVNLDPGRAGHGVVSMAVDDLHETVRELLRREVPVGSIEPVGDAGHKAVVHDPDGNTVALIEVAAP